MRIDDLRLLFAYSYAATGRVTAAAERLTLDEYLDTRPATSDGSLRDILVHTLDGERGWREELRFGTWSEASRLDPADFPDVQTLIRAWRQDQGQMMTWLATLDDEALDGLEPNGPRRRPLWVCLTHVVNHGTQHRSEAAMILTQFGHPPGDLDLSSYLDGWSTQ